MPIGPHGEKRTVSPVANANHMMQVALGMKEEEYVKPGERKTERKVDSKESTKNANT